MKYIIALAISLLSFQTEAWSLFGDNTGDIVIPAIARPVVDFTTSYNFGPPAWTGYTSTGPAFGWASISRVGVPSMVPVTAPARWYPGPSNTLQVTVAYGDVPFVGEPTERCELSNQTQYTEDNTSGTKFYAMSVYLPSNWVSPTCGACTGSSSTSSSISGTTLTIGGTVTGTFGLYQTLGPHPAVYNPTTIVGLGTGTGGAGTYIVDYAQTVPTGTIISDGDYTMWGAVTQLHAPNSYSQSPVFSLDVASSHNPGHYTAVVEGGALTGPPTPQQNLNLNFYDLGPLQLGVWVDFVFQITFSTTNGVINVFMRSGTPSHPRPTTALRYIKTINQPNLYSFGGTVLPHYWNTGFYRNADQSTSIVYLGPWTRATTFVDAALSSFGVYP